MINQDYLKSILHYDPDSGEFTWLQQLGPTTRVGERAGTVDKSGHRVVRIQGKVYRETQLAWLYMRGAAGSPVSHINGVIDDNRFANLSLTFGAGSRVSIHSSSGLEGVHRCRDRWKAQVSFEGKLYYIGVFDDKEEAYKSVLAVKDLLGAP